MRPIFDDPTSGPGWRNATSKSRDIVVIRNVDALASRQPIDEFLCQSFCPHRATVREARRPMIPGCHVATQVAPRGNRAIARRKYGNIKEKEFWEQHRNRQKQETNLGVGGSNPSERATYFVGAGGIPAAPRSRRAQSACRTTKRSGTGALRALAANSLAAGGKRHFLGSLFRQQRRSPLALPRWPRHETLGRHRRVSRRHERVELNLDVV